jgi:uncharacterized protein YqgC (DUF456 family)
MDYVLILFGLLFVVVGLIGCFIPILPGPPLSWLGVFLLYISENTSFSGKFIIIWLFIAAFVTALDYFIPIWGTKKFGGSKMGIRGSIAGLIIGVFFPPFGIIIGPFLGAFVGELINNSQEKKQALKAAFGSFLGFVLGTGLKLAVSITLGYYFIEETIQLLS